MRTQECKYFRYREGYPYCDKFGLCCDPTEDEKCEYAVKREEEDGTQD